MDRAEILEVLTALAAELERRGTSGEMYVVGGAAIALAFDERRATRYVDAVFEPKSVVYEAAAVVAEQRGLPTGVSVRTRRTCGCWLASSASGAPRRRWRSPRRCTGTAWTRLPVSSWNRCSRRMRSGETVQDLCQNP